MQDAVSGTRCSGGAVSQRRTAKNHADAHAAIARRPRWKGPLVADLALAVRSEPFSAPGWIYELKYDGFRLLAAKDGGEVVLRYRSGRVATAVFPDLTTAVRRLPAHRALLDGELVAFGEDGRPSFDLLRARALSVRGHDADVRFCVFDLLMLDDADLRQLAVVDRKTALRKLLAGADHRLVYVDHTSDGEQLLTGARALRLEGIVAKRAESPYTAGRSECWKKIKIEDTADFLVVGIAGPSRTTFDRPSLVLASDDAGSLRYVGRVAVGRDHLAALNTVIPRLRRPSSPLTGAGRADVWLEPAVVVEVRFLASGGRGLRHAALVRFRPDKMRPGGR